MIKQLSLFPELAQRLASNLDEMSLNYARDHYFPEFSENDVGQAFKDGALAVLSDIIDLLKKYTDLHES